MKALKEAFVIVKQHESPYDFFTDLISFHKPELDTKCKKLNDSLNDDWRKAHEKKKKAHPFQYTTVYVVMDLNSAIEKLRDITIDYYMPDDESR